MWYRFVRNASLVSQVAPAEIDAILLTHPDVADAATVGVPDEMAGDLPKAFVVRTPGANVSAQQLVDFVAGELKLNVLIIAGADGGGAAYTPPPPTKNFPSAVALIPNM